MFDYIPSTEEVESSRKFVSAHEDCYADDGQSDRATKDSQKFVGKLAEFAVGAMYRNCGIEVVRGVDCEVYDSRDRTWNPDLMIRIPVLSEEVPVCVKSQPYHSAINYGLSWMWECGPSRRDRIFDLGDDHRELVALVLSYSSLRQRVVGVLWWSEVRKLLGEPKKESLKHCKRVLYYRRLRETFLKRYPLPEHQVVQG